jgi:hypothetical protein
MEEHLKISKVGINQPRMTSMKIENISNIKWGMKNPRNFSRWEKNMRKTSFLELIYYMTFAP